MLEEIARADATHVARGRWGCMPTTPQDLVANEHDEHAKKLSELQRQIDAQDEAMLTLNAHAAELSAQGVELPAGPQLAELDAIVEKAITSARTTTIHYGLRA